MRAGGTSYEIKFQPPFDPFFKTLTIAVSGRILTISRKKKFNYRIIELYRIVLTLVYVFRSEIWTGRGQKNGMTKFHYFCMFEMQNTLCTVCFPCQLGIIYGHYNGRLE